MPTFSYYAQNWTLACRWNSFLARVHLHWRKSDNWGSDVLLATRWRCAAFQEAGTTHFSGWHIPSHNTQLDLLQMRSRSSFGVFCGRVCRMVLPHHRVYVLECIGLWSRCLTRVWRAPTSVALTHFHAWCGVFTPPGCGKLCLWINIEVSSSEQQSWFLIWSLCKGRAFRNVYVPHVHVRTPDFSWLLPLYCAKKVNLQRKTSDIRAELRGGTEVWQHRASAWLLPCLEFPSLFGFSDLSLQILTESRNRHSLFILEVFSTYKGLFKSLHTLTSGLWSACLAFFTVWAYFLSVLQMSNKVRGRWNAVCPARNCRKEPCDLCKSAQTGLLSLEFASFFFWIESAGPLPLPPGQPSTPKCALLSETTCWVGPDGLSHCLLHLFEESLFFLLGWCLTRLLGGKREKL